MNSVRRNTDRLGRSLVMICFLVSAVSSSGCEPLRKKFIRQKKKDKEQTSEVIPILEPIAYPEKVYSSEELYKQHYTLWRAWYADLLIDISESNSSTKHLTYNLEQSILQLQEMQRLIVAERQGKLRSLINGLEKIREDFNQPRPLINTGSLKLKLESLGKEIREKYKFIKIQDNLVKE